jgi:hypothetical protein
MFLQKLLLTSIGQHCDISQKAEFFITIEVITYMRKVVRAVDVHVKDAELDASR